MESKEEVEKLILPEPTHIGYVTRDIEKTMENLCTYFGVEPFKEMVPEYFNRRYRGEPGNFKMRLAFTRVGNFVYELIQVLEGKTIYEDFMSEHGEGVHHLGYEVSNLGKWTEAYRKAGIEPIMSGERTGLKWAYFDTPGITVELLERAPEGKVV